MSSLAGDAPLIIVGSSVGDESLESLLYHRKREAPGYLVAPRVSPAERRRFEGRGLEVIDASADQLFSELSRRMDRA